MVEDRAVRLTPGVARWLRDLVTLGPTAVRPKGAVAYRARREGLTDWWMRDLHTGAEMIMADVPREHIPLGERYRTVGEALTERGRRALSSSGDGGEP